MDLTQRGAHGPRPVRVAQVLLLVAVVLVLISALLGIPDPEGLHDPVDGALQVAAYLLCALVAVLRPWSSPVDRTLWLLVAAGVVLRASGYVVYVSVVRGRDTVDYPSPADALWLLMCVVLLAALVQRTRVLGPRMTLALVLDALLGALTIAGLAVALLYGTVVRLTAEGTATAAVLTNLAYPIVDTALLVIVTGLLFATRPRPPRSDWLLSLGVLGLAVVDTAFLVQVSEGGVRLGPGLSALSILATATIALAGWVGPLEPREPADEGWRPGVMAPAILSTLCVSSLVYVSFFSVPPAAIALMALALLVAIARAVLTIVRDRTETRSVLLAKNEELRRFQALVETSTDFVAIADMERRVLYVNPAGRRMVGLASDADLSGTTIADFLTEDGRRISADLEQPELARHGRWRGESTLRHFQHGGTTPVAISTFLMRHSEGSAPFAMATVQRDITELRNAERALQEVADQRQVLLGRLVQAQEDERARIAADVHDDSVQALAAVDLRLGLMRRTLAEAAPETLPGFDEVREAVTGAVGRLRHLLFDLDPPALSGGLADALRDAAHYLLEESGVDWEVTGGGDSELPRAELVTAYRIAKEAIVNARKHADAHHLVVILAARDGGLEVTVADDGRGFDPAEGRDRPGHLGLGAMRDRAEIAGGRLEVDSTPGQGTTVRLWLPILSGVSAAPPSGPAPRG